jgi:5'-AMP-activated protein kinase catalytic alpha subunit
MKLENLLINKKDIVKLADFGLSNIMKDGKYLTTSCGSPHYAAPEIIEAKYLNSLYGSLIDLTVVPA